MWQQLPGTATAWNGKDVPNSIIVGRNISGGPLSWLSIIAPVNYLWLDPESQSVSVVFTAPEYGAYAVAGDFLGIDVVGNPHPVSIVLNHSSSVSATLAAYQQDLAFSLHQVLNAGDTIAFEVGTGAASSLCSYCFLSTGLRATVETIPTGAPEPGSIARGGQSFQVQRRQLPVEHRQLSNAVHQDLSPLRRQQCLLRVESPDG